MNPLDSRNVMRSLQSYCLGGWVVIVGRSDLEKADPYLRTQLRFQDTLSNLVAAAFVSLSAYVIV